MSERLFSINRAHTLIFYLCRIHHRSFVFQRLQRQKWGEGCCRCRLLLCWTLCASPGQNLRTFITKCFKNLRKNYTVPWDIPNWTVVSVCTSQVWTMIRAFRGIVHIKCPSLGPSGIGAHLGRNRLWVRFLALSDNTYIYHIPCSIVHKAYDYLSPFEILRVHMAQSCPRVTFLGPDPTRPVETLTRPDPTRDCRQKVWPNPTRPAARPFPNKYSLQLNNYIY